MKSKNNTCPVIANENSQIKCQVKYLENSDLLLRFGKLVQTERKITHLVVECIAEIDRRKLYLGKAYPSIYEFLTKGYGYEEASAMRRISAARVLNQIPEIAPKIESGALSLSQLSAVATGFRQAEKVTGQKLDLTQKKELLSKIEYASYRQTEKIIAQEFDLPIPKHEKQQVHQDDSITLTMNFTKEEMAVLLQAKDLISHSVPENSWSKVISYLAMKEVNHRTKIKGAAGKVHKAETSLSKGSEASITVAPARKPISPNVRKFILKRDQCCQHKDPITQKICGSKWLCQVDHIQPIWAGGTNEIENLQLLCAQHNQLKYRKESFQSNLESTSDSRLNSPPNRRYQEFRD